MMKSFKRLLNADEGTILTEALIVVPFVTIFAVGILEFGNVFWQRHLLEVGVRDAARYWSRCKPSFNPCSVTIARNFAFFGNPDGTGPLRVPNWYGDVALTITPLEPPVEPDETDLVVVTGETIYAASPLVSMLRIGDVAISYSHQQRYIGW